MKTKKIEVLAPAGNPAALKAAVFAGADAVYMGGSLFSARASAVNFSREEMREAVLFARERNVRVYVTVNTLLKDDELPEALDFCKFLCSVPVDGILIQDMGLFNILREACPEMPLHASTQMSLHTPGGAALLKELGASRVVLAREMSLKEIEEVSKKTDVELEAFVHGALCMSLSGQCYFSAMLGGRSGNRGRCAQTCRLPFAAPGGTGHDLSLKDMSFIDHIETLHNAGVCSAKIEGRMKRPEYVAAAVAACRKAADGEPVPENLLEHLNAVFSRSGFTDSYLSAHRGRIMFGTRTKEDVESANSAVFAQLHTLYKNEAQRVPVTFTLSAFAGENPRVTVSDGENEAVVTAEDCVCEIAQKLPVNIERWEQQLRKTGGTPYLCEAVQIDTDEKTALPISALNGLRREALKKLGAKLICGEDYLESIDEDMLFRAPGVPYLLPELQKARANGVAVTSEMEVFFDLCPCKIYAVTGSDGKTTTTYLLKQLLERCLGAKVGLIGTNQNMIGDAVLPAERTTPDALTLQRLLREMADAGCTHVVMEVSSHALVQRRVGAIDFALGVFTNLTQDHLDYHGTMEAYCDAKARLFRRCRAAAVNGDDPWTPRLLENVTCPVTRFGQGLANDLVGWDAHYCADRVSFTACSDSEHIPVTLHIPGAFSLYNALAALAAAQALGIPIEDAAQALSLCQGVRGRAEVVPTDTDYTVLIDYAHTPDGLKNILSTVCGFADARVLVVFGCGGDRDRTKRAEMGRIAARLADEVIVTSDNPRTENPYAILHEILAGMADSATPFAVLESRREAIAYAIENHCPGDVIILCGKGHEDYQIIHGKKEHFVEREIIKEACAELKK